MNIKIATLSILSIAAIAGSAQSAEAKGARFDFAPNVWAPNIKQAQQPAPFDMPVRQPVVAIENHNVRQGSMPRNLFGDPSFLAKAAPRVAPIVRPSVMAQPSFTQVAAKQVPAAPPIAFNAKFGNPINLSPPVVAAPQQAAERSLPPSKPIVASKPSFVNANRGVHAKLYRPTAPRALAATGKSIDNYGGKFFSSTPYVIGSGTQTSTDTRVKAVLWKPNHR